MAPRLLLGAMLALAAFSPAMARPLAPVALDDFYRLADVAEPAFSPDGTRIAYSVTLGDRTLDKQLSDVWVVPWRGGAAVRLTTNAKASESKPRFSADGRWLFFLSDAGTDDAKDDDPMARREVDDENTQLWRMPAAGGKAQRLTTLPAGISDYDISPDGQLAVVVAEVGRTVGRTEGTPPPIEIDRYYFKEDTRGYLDDRARQLFVVDLASGRARPITSGARDNWHPSWSPDGRWIAYAAQDQDGATDRTLNSDIYVIELASGVPKRISASPNDDDDLDWEGGISWSPDSKRIVWLESGEDKWIYYSPPQLAVADIATGAVGHPAQIDRWFYKPRFAPDGSILALIEQDRDTWLARIDPASGKLRYLSTGKRFGTDFAVARQGRIALLQSDSRTPRELYALPNGRRLTRSNDWLTGRALGDVRDVAYRSGDVAIHGYLTLPPGIPARHLPLIVDLHGGPVYQHSHEFDLDERLYAAAGYAVLALNPRGSSGRGFDFSRAIYADWGNLDVQDISAGITDSIKSGVADPERIGAGGWSYGGILTDYMIASDKRIRAAVSGAGVGNILATYGVDMYAREYLLELGTPWENFDTYRKLAYPLLQAQRITAPTLFQCAGADDNVPCPGAQQMYLALKTRGIPTHLTVYPGENHGLDVPSYLVARRRSDIAWYDRWLKGAGAK